MRKEIENIILLVTVILGIWSILMVLSTTINSTNFSNLYIKQSIAFLVGLVVLMAMRSFSYEILEELGSLFYIVAVFMLIGVLVFGAQINGSRRWFNLGFFHFQPVEFAKLSVILFLPGIMNKYKSLVFAILPIVIVMVLVLAQPDAGSSALFLPILIMMLIVSRINTNWMMLAMPYAFIMVISLFLESYLSVKSTSLINIKYLIYPIFVTGVICFMYREVKNIKRYLKLNYMLLLIVMFWFSFGAGVIGSNVLKDYQKRRIVSFMLPEMDPLGAGYNIRQSIMAVGSGKLFGRGLFEGTQTQLGFLPVKHTDFIFASVAEELGMLGALIMLLLLAILLWQILKIMERSEDMGGRLICAGIFAIIFSQIVLNLGVTLGLLPVIGVQLPFVSYGGTGMVLFMGMIGILLNINRRTERIGK